MIRILLKSLSMLMVLGLWSATAYAQSVAQEPWWGVWVNDTPGRKFIMEPWEDGIKMVSLVRLPDGSEMRAIAFARFDGKIYPESGNPGADGIRFTRIDDRTYEYEGSNEGKLIMRATISFPPDGITRITHLSYANGQEVDVKTVWRRELLEDDAPWFGTWSDGRATLSIEPWEDGFTLISQKPPQSAGDDYQHVTLFARFDGEAYPVAGDPAADAARFGLNADGSYWMVLMKDGKDSAKLQLSFSDNGKTRIAKSMGSDGEILSESKWQRVEW